MPLTFNLFPGAALRVPHPRSLAPDPALHLLADSLVHHRVQAAGQRGVGTIGSGGCRVKLAPAEHPGNHVPYITQLKYTIEYSYLLKLADLLFSFTMREVPRSP